MIAVTGAAGFIGSNLCRALTERYQADVVAIDDLRGSAKLENLTGLPLRDIVSLNDFNHILERSDGWLGNLEAVIHLGACTDTRRTDWEYVFATNTHFSKLLLEASICHRVPFLYASSAAVYGLEGRFAEHPLNERPRGLYAWSKAVFDWHARKVMPAAESPLIGLRYFNVYGPGERHKGPMASLIYQLHIQVRHDGEALLYGNLPECADGEQRRDFVAVSDAVRVTLWFLEHTGVSGIFNVGTGVAISFNDVARLVLEHHGGGAVRYVPLPAAICGTYQLFTQADLRALRAAGYLGEMTHPATGIPAYLRHLSAPTGAAPATVQGRRTTPAQRPRDADATHDPDSGAS